MGIGILGKYNCWSEAVHRQRGRCINVWAAAAHRPGLAVDPRPASIAACGHALSLAQYPGCFWTPAVGPVPITTYYSYVPYILVYIPPIHAYVHTNVHCPVCGPQPGWPSLSCSCHYQVGGRGPPGSKKTAAAVGDNCNSDTRRVPAPGTSILTAHEVGTKYLGHVHVGKQSSTYLGRLTVVAPG